MSDKMNARRLWVSYVAGMVGIDDVLWLPLFFFSFSQEIEVEVKEVRSAKFVVFPAVDVGVR